MKPKKEIRLYNVILPIWMLWIVPPLWLIILPAKCICRKSSREGRSMFMKPKKEIRLYNVILPIWMLWIVPPLWLIILPANFIIDFTVFILHLSL